MCCVCVCVDGCGGAISATLNAHSTLTLEAVILQQCSAERGGAICLSLQAAPSTLSFSTITLYGMNNQATDGEAYGHTLYIYTPHSSHLSGISESNCSSFVTATAGVNKEAKIRISSDDPVTLAGCISHRTQSTETDGSLSPILYMHTFYVAHTAGRESGCQMTNTH